ncbi:CBS domain-containing protein [Arthrobacter sp.]|uniref:CBS domain-containing protein n=1 Tax=Arthrobacter sp. TaxID=1667 RepID=UPI0026E0A347|nr:CBS domain-containing protein [Arthrobacter sp.]MDO5752586.1 CBS domain-containing protein [Arthrobacter sp.]
MDARIPATAADIMSSPVIAIPGDTAVAEIADLLRANRISGVPVVDDSGHVLGLVSEFDLLAKEGATAASLMTTAVISVSAGTRIADLRHLLIEKRVRRLPVLEDGRVVGIVSRGDIVSLLATEWVCAVCGEPVRGPTPPDKCPRCQADGSRFELHEQSPGT